MCAQPVDDSPHAPAHLCVVCRKEIPVGASKCTECDSFQNWRRHLLEWTGFGAAVLAILPLWGSAVSLYRIAFPESADVAVSVASCSTTEISSFIVNQGGESAIVAPPTVVLQTDDADMSGPLKMNFPIGDDAKVIEGSEVDVVTLSPPPGAEFPAKSADEPVCDLVVTFAITALDGSSATKSGTCPCPGAPD
jgi:hypothetical protein